MRTSSRFRTYALIFFVGAFAPKVTLLAQTTATPLSQTFVLKEMTIDPADLSPFDPAPAGAAAPAAAPTGPTCTALIKLYADVAAAPQKASAACTAASLGFEYLVVNVVDWSSPASPNQPVSTWYLLSPANPRKPSSLAVQADHGSRIFGSTKIAVLFIHRHLADAHAADVKYTLTGTHHQSVQLADGIALLQLIAPAAMLAPGAPPPPTETILAIATTVGALPRLPDTLVFTSQAFQDKATEASNGKPDGTFSQSYEDEGYAYWDISAAIPITGIKDVTYSQSGATVQPKTVTRENAYALAHFYPFPVDLRGDAQPWYPSIVGGLPISGAPLDKPFVGLAIGMKKIGRKKALPLQLNVFAGAVFNKVFTPASATDAALLNSHRVTKLLYGIDIPIGALVKAVAGK